MCSDAHSITLK